MKRPEHTAAFPAADRSRSKVEPRPAGTGGLRRAGGRSSRIRLAGVVAVFATLAFGVAPAGAGDDTHRFQRLFNHYDSIREELASGGLSEVAYHADELGVLARVLAGEIRRSGREGAGEIAAQLQGISDAARDVALAPDLEEARAAFARLSRAMVAYRGVAGVEDPVVYLCVLHNNVWLQRSGDRIANPYMGEDEGDCSGSLEVKKPRWLPSWPSLRTPGEQPPGLPGGS